VTIAFYINTYKHLYNTLYENLNSEIGGAKGSHLAFFMPCVDLGLTWAVTEA